MKCPRHVVIVTVCREIRKQSSKILTSTANVDLFNHELRLFYVSMHCLYIRFALLMTSKIKNKILASIFTFCFVVLILFYIRAAFSKFRPNDVMQMPLLSLTSSLNEAKRASKLPFWDHQVFWFFIMITLHKEITAFFSSTFNIVKVCTISVLPFVLLTFWYHSILFCSISVLPTFEVAIELPSYVLIGVSEVHGTVQAM